MNSKFRAFEHKQISLLRARLTAFLFAYLNSTGQNLQLTTKFVNLIEAEREMSDQSARFLAVFGRYARKGH